MAINKKQVSMPINPVIFEEFKKKCNVEGLKINFVVECLMNFYIDNDFELVTNRYGQQLQLRQKNF